MYFTCTRYYFPAILPQYSIYFPAVKDFSTSVFALECTFPLQWDLSIYIAKLFLQRESNEINLCVGGKVIHKWTSFSSQTFSRKTRIDRTIANFFYYLPQNQFLMTRRWKSIFQLNNYDAVTSVPDRRRRIIPEVVLVGHWSVGVLGI